MLKATVRIIEITELVGVSHQQANKIADAPGFPSPVEREGQSRLWDRRRLVDEPPVVLVPMGDHDPLKRRVDLDQALDRWKLRLFAFHRDKRCPDV